MIQTFVGAEVYLPGEITEATVTMDGGTIVEIGGPVQGAEIDARGKILAPALIDLHGDAFERQVMPRPGVFFPMETAVLETDRQLAANGIATTYHSITLSYEPGLRSVERGRAMMQALRDLAPRLSIENCEQLRWETFAFEALETLDWAMDAPLTPSLAFNDHLSMTMAPAQAARDNGDLIIFGAPNAVRGGSHIGSLGAADMVEAGLCDALASDYYYPAMLAAVARLDHERRAGGLRLWSLVSNGPAQAMGLHDRGEIAVGKRADLVLVDWPDGATPAVQGTWVAGRAAYLATPFG